MNIFNYFLVVAFCALTVYRTTDGRRTKPKEPKNKNDKVNEMDSMICPDCDRLFCTVRKASKLKCKGGKTTDICGCCPVCARQADEPCGGEWNYLGKCDKGLYCKAPSSGLLASSFQQQIKAEVPMRGMPEGYCAKIEILDDGSPSGDPLPQDSSSAKCKPKCSPDFCLENPRSICSAVDVVDMKRDCHGTCQHTSCQACSWVDPDPDCGACESDDFNCIKRFAKCIKRSYCTRSKFPCKSIAEKDHVGKFQCMVPKCLDSS